MDSAIEESIDGFARRGEVVVMAGAGVSAGAPTSSPGWKPLNTAIVSELCRRLGCSIGRHAWLSQIVLDAAARRDAEAFPPEYQAQIIHEACGEHYFRGLQALDVSVVNGAHAGIAALAGAQALRAVVTTNFDRLIEQALDEAGVAFEVAFTDAQLKALGERLGAGEAGPLPVIKIHGCVSDCGSMIDTLKQRRGARSNVLEACLSELHPGYWLYLGFSAADLEGNPDYLGLRAGAARSAGATYLTRSQEPGTSAPHLGAGATVLMQAHGDRGRSALGEIAPYLAQRCRALGAWEPRSVAQDGVSGRAQFDAKLARWADGLRPSTAGLCLAAILEAIGQAESAVRLLGKLLEELRDEQGSAEYRALQLHHGRLGAAWGRFIGVPGINGAASNASVETTQSLARLSGTELEFPASTWLMCARLWVGEGDAATRTAIEMMRGFLDGSWRGPGPRSPEEKADAWIAAAQVLIVNLNEQTGTIIVGTSEKALDNASGDVARLARVRALWLFALAHASSSDVPALAQAHSTDFQEAERVGDGFALGMRSLALARWHVSAAGLALARSADSKSVADQALKYLRQAEKLFQDQGMDPWRLFSLVQQAKAHADLQQWDEAQRCIGIASQGVERFPIFASHFYEAAAQMQKMHGSGEAGGTLQAALQAAEDSGLNYRRQTLLRYVQPRDE